MNLPIHANSFVSNVSAFGQCIGRSSLKYLLVMKLILLLVTVLSLHSFGRATAQSVSIHVENSSFKRVVQLIRQQTGYSFIIKDEFARMAKPVTLAVKDKDIKEVLPLLFANQPFDYQVTGKIVSIVAKKQVRVLQKTSVQQTSVRGRVTDSIGNGLEGVIVEAEGTSLRTATDKNGYYVLSEVLMGSNIMFRLIGYETIKVTANRPEVNIVLLQVVSQLTEVEVNAGYWKVNDKLRTGNISRVDGETIRQQPIIDPTLALAGRVAGLVVSQQSGLPGAYHAMRIRGNNSLSNGNEPLFLIDGLPFSSATLSNSVIGTGATRVSPFSLLNPEEIESIEVLKDADATAIYGSRGANGVILITTKKGRVGRTAININAATGFGNVTRMMDMLNTEQYLEMRREAFANDGVTTYPANAYDVNGTWDENRYTDWQKILIGNTSRMSSIQGQISGGSTQLQFVAGGGYTDETTVFPGDYETKKSTVNFSLNHQSENKKFTFSLSARYASNFTDQPQIDLATNIIRLAPNSPSLYDDFGNLNWENETWDNPMAYANRRAKLNSKNLIANTTLKYQILDALEVKMNIGYNNLGTEGSNITPLSSYRPSYSSFSAIRSHTRAESNQNTWITEPQLNYNKQLGNGKLETTIGTTFQRTDNYTLAVRAENFSDDVMLENLMAAGTISIVQNRQTEYRYAALFGRINYNLRDKYIVNLVARRDGSTRFAPDRKYGNFASMGAAYVFSNETIFHNSILSFGKIRASYGITGNDQLTDYQYLSTYSSYNNPYLGITGLYPTRLYTSDYGWEAVRKIEGTLDLGFWENKIKLSTTYYRNRTDNQLVGYPLPTMTGFPSIQGNLPAVLENKGWELELNTINISNNRFKWHTSFNISLPDSKLISFPDFENSSYRNTYEIGKPLSILKAFHWTGVDPETGVHTYEDVNSDGNITSPQDLQPLMNLGRRYYGGLSNSVSYLGLSLDVFFQFVKKNGRLPSAVPGVAFVNQPTQVMDRWQRPGDITDVQRFTQSGTAFSTMVTGLSNSDMVYDDASFIRLKNLSISYQLPTRFVKSYWLSQCRFFAQGQNLLTFSRYRGLDPETETALPVVRMITVGVNIAL